MTDVDRRLVFLISELTDGVVWPLRSVVEEWGRERAARVIADCFGVIYPGPDDLSDLNFLPTEEALALLHHLREGDDYVIAEWPWGAVSSEDEPDLIIRYAADDAEAAAEVRARHAERRERWEKRESR